MPSRNRGKPKPKLRDLSYIPPTAEEYDALRHAILTAPSITAAILGAAMVEYELETLLRSRFLRKDDGTWKELTTENGPLSSFYSKIIAGYAFRIYDEDTKVNLGIVRNIRNAFAHSKKLIDFNHDLIVDELKKAKGSRRFTKGYGAALQRSESRKENAYIFLCVTLTMQLARKKFRAARASTKREMNRLRREMSKPLYSPFGNMAAALLRSQGLLGFPPLPAPGHQNADPTSEARPRSPPGLLDPESFPPRSKSK